MLFDPLHEFMRVCHYLRDQVMFVVILKVVDFLQVLIVLFGYIFNVGEEILILQVHSPEKLVIVFFLDKHRLLVLLSSLG